jgi:FMN phosphatase YigB (HAD superfamily)
MASHKFSAVVLDLYDTLVRWDPAQLPEVEWRGRKFRSTDPFQIEILKPRFGDTFDLERWLDAYHSVVVEVMAERESGETETTCDERFVRALTRFGMPPGAAMAALTRELTQVHMSHVRRVTSAPAERVAAVRKIAPHYRLGLLSNFDDSRTGHEVLSDTGVAHLFEAVIISADVGMRKPNPKIFERMLAMLSLPAGEILFVGDTPEHDVAGAARVGMRTAWISAGKGPWPAEMPPPDFVIADLAELPAIVGL